MTAIVCVGMACLTVMYAVTAVIWYQLERSSRATGNVKVSPSENADLRAQIKKLQDEVSSHSLALGLRPAKR